MRILRSSISILILSTSLAACAVPTSEPSFNEQATSVALALTAAPTALPTATPPPSATPIITPSPTPTASQTPGPSPTPTPPILAESDPRYGIELGQPTYQDDFSNRATWYPIQVEDASLIIQDGQLRATDQIAQGRITWSTTTPNVDLVNYYLEVDTKLTDCAGKDSYGVGFRIVRETYDSGYLLEFACDGTYRVRKLAHGRFETLQDWTKSASIFSGSNATNRLGILADGSQLFFFANGTILSPNPIQDHEFTLGTFGLFANAQETEPLTVYFDQFSLWYPLP